MALLKRPYAYSKIEFGDGDEMEHRRAQFLIYKVLQKADNTRRRQSCLRVRVCKLKIKIGEKLKKLRKRFCSATILAKADFCKQLSSLLKSCKRFFLQGKHDSVIRAAPAPVFC